MSKSTVPQRAKKYADNFNASQDLTLQHAACAGFRAGFEAHELKFAMLFSGQVVIP